MQCIVITLFHLHVHLDYSLGQLFKLSIEAGHMCLSKWAETSVALAALELMGGLAKLEIDDASESLSLSLFLFLSFSLHPSLDLPLHAHKHLNIIIFTFHACTVHVQYMYIPWFIETQEIAICLYVCIYHSPNITYQSQRHTAG